MPFASFFYYMPAGFDAWAHIGTKLRKLAIHYGEDNSIKHFHSFADLAFRWWTAFDEKDRSGWVDLRQAFQ